MKPLIQVLGATGVGKSQAAFALAGRFGAEIISADSVQVYRGFDIGTDKVDAQRRLQIPHHLIDIIDDCSQFNASRFLELAFAAAEQISARNAISRIRASGPRTSEASWEPISLLVAIEPNRAPSRYRRLAGSALRPPS